MAIILAADDEPAAREIVDRILTRAGHEVHTCTDGETALRAIRSLRPDLILTDVDMPLINGFLLCDEVRNDPELAETPVILVTGVIDPDDQRATQVRATEVLAKPFSGEQLLACVQRHLATTPA